MLVLASNFVDLVSSRVVRFIFEGEGVFFNGVTLPTCALSVFSSGCGVVGSLTPLLIHQILYIYIYIYIYIY